MYGSVMTSQIPLKPESVLFVLYYIKSFYALINPFFLFVAEESTK